MRIGHPPHNDNEDRLDEFRGEQHADDDLPPQALTQGDRSPHRGDEFLAVLSPLLEEAAGLESQHRDAGDLLVLLEENARLRKLAVKLSNLLGDLPVSAAGEIEPRRPSLWP
jgi:hypothetical protein